MKKWEHEVKSHVIKAYPKIRSIKRKFCETETGKLLEEPKRLQLTAKENPSEENMVKLAAMERNIADKISEHYKENIDNALGHLTAEDGGSAIMESGKPRVHLCPMINLILQWQ